MGDIGDPYVTSDELKAYLNDSSASGPNDAQYQGAVESASVEIEDFCQRQFNQGTATNARVYEFSDNFLYGWGSRWLDLVRVDDFSTLTGLVVKVGTPEALVTVDPGEYRVLPANGVVNGHTWSYHSIRFNNGRILGRDEYVEVTAKWGWPSVPTPVKQACLIMAAHNLKMGDAPLGVAGFNSWGSVRVREMPLAHQKLMKYVRQPIMVG